MPTRRRLPAQAALLVSMAAIAIGRSPSASAQPLFEPSLGLAVDESYDSNVFNGRGPDWVTRVSPHFALQLRDERSLIQGTYDLGLWDYARGKADQSVNQRAALSLQEQLTERVWIKVGDELIRAEDPGYITRAAIIAPQTGILDNLAEAEVAARLTRVLDFALIYRYHLTRFDAQPPGAAPLFNGDEHRAAASLLMRATRLDGLLFSGEVQYFTISGDPLAFTVGTSFGWRRQILRSLELRIAVGPLWYHGEAAARRIPDGFSGQAIDWRGSVVLRWVRGPFRLALSGVRDFLGGTGAGSVVWADYVALQGGVRIARRFGAWANVAYFANGFAPDQPRRFDGVSFDVGADWHFHPLFAVGAYYSFRWQEAEGAAFPQLTRHIVGARLGFLWGAEAAPIRREVHE
jgi:hypothetical protein